MVSSLPVPTIHPLPTDLVHLITASEVIDSWAAVVRELVENAIDAQASRLVISLMPELEQIQVADNGQGMAIADLHHCAQPHSTSKIKALDDLWHLSSLGFRGEALHSIAQVANLTIASRSALFCSESLGSESLGAETGWRIHYAHNGNPQRVEQAAIAPGTIVTVRDLFETLPQRRESLPSLNQQLKAIQATIYPLALCHPHLTWQLFEGDRLWLSISPGHTAQDILPQCVKGIHFHDLYYAKTVDETRDPAEPSSRIEWIMGLPDRCHRRRPDWVKVAINGRVVRSTALEQTLLAGFVRTLPRDRFPVCFLHLHLPPDQIDWNRNSAKSEIYLKNTAFWQEKITQIISSSLGSTILPTKLHHPKLHNQRLGKLLKTAELAANYPVRATESSALNRMTLKAVGQVNQTYIVAEHSQGLWLVEQHIAHERVIFEQLQSDWQIVALDSPILLDRLSPFQREQLERLGLKIEPFGEDLWAVRSLPQLWVEREDCLEGLRELSLGGDLQTAQVAVACRSAIRNGTPLSAGQMQQLLNDWQQTRNPRTCPHGRPIYLGLEESSLARFFRRNWMIGKSHGI